MTDEEYSDMAEMLAEACDRVVAAGITVWPGGCCPFGALLWYPLGPLSPWADAVTATTGLPEADVANFMRGFDGRACDGDRRAHQLGAQFRIQYAGSYYAPR